MNGFPKRHHWWPQCHSTLWINDESCVTRIAANGEVTSTQPINTAVISHYYSVVHPDGSRDPRLESYFADEIESPVGPVLARLSTETHRDFEFEARFDKAFLRRERKGICDDGFVPDERAFSAKFAPADRRALARYIASLIVRVPSYKDELNSNRMLENVAAVLGVNVDKAHFETDRLHVEIIRSHLDDYADQLINCAFLLIDAPDGEEYIIGDTPVIPASLGFGEAEAMCPISPTRSLLIIAGWKPPVSNRIMIVRSQRKSVRAFNKTMLQNAEREVFCRTVIPTVWVTKHLGTRKVRIIPNIETAVGNHLARGPILDRSRGKV